MTRSLRLRLVVFGFLAGVGMAYWWGILVCCCLAAGLVGGVFVLRFLKWNVLKDPVFFHGIVIVLALFCCGFLRYFFAIADFGVQDIASYRDLGAVVEVEGMVAAEPDVRSDSQHIVVETHTLVVKQLRISVHGKVLLKAQSYPRLLFGDALRLRCKLVSPPHFDNFSYDALLAEQDIYVLCVNPSVKILERGRGDWFWSTVFALKGALTQQINALFTEPEASLVAGILLGLRRAIPQTVLDHFNTDGLTHVLAISGYNVTMMIMVFGMIFAKGSRRVRFAGMVGGILLLVVFTGFSASVIRAAIMGGLVLCAQMLGRKGNGLNVLLLSGGLMIFFNPQMMMVDLSFQLSFLSTLGLLLFMPHIERWQEGFPILKKLPEFVREGFFVTMAAQVFTTPLLLLQFGRFSLIAPVANIFVLPLVPWIMLFGFAATVLGFLFLPLAQIAALVALFLVKLMLFFVDVFASVPFAAFQLRS